MRYGSETWAVKDSDVLRLNCINMRMVNVKPGGVKAANVELRDRIGLECISAVMQRSRLRWFGHVEKMGDGNWMKKIRSINFEEKLNMEQGHTERPQGYRFKCLRVPFWGGDQKCPQVGRHFRWRLTEVS